MSFVEFFGIILNLNFFVDNIYKNIMLFVENFF